MNPLICINIGSSQVTGQYATLKSIHKGRSTNNCNNVAIWTVSNIALCLLQFNYDFLSHDSY